MSRRRRAHDPDRAWRWTLRVVTAVIVLAAVATLVLVATA